MEITLDNIILVESSFSRINSVSFGEEVHNDVHIHTDISVNGQSLIVGETVSVKQTYRGVEQMNIKVKMVGVFSVVGEINTAELDSFGKVNGAAIIYPFIREIIADMTLKAGVQSVILPIVNFVKVNEKKNTEQSDK